MNISDLIKPTKTKFLVSLIVFFAIALLTFLGFGTVYKNTHCGLTPLVEKCSEPTFTSGIGFPEFYVPYRMIDDYGEGANFYPLQFAINILISVIVGFILSAYLVEKRR
jgi:hypothetical protein